MPDSASDESSIGASPEEKGTDESQGPPSSDGESQPLRNAVAALGAMLGSERADGHEGES